MFLPAPPSFPHYFLEDPWPVIAGFVVVGLVLLYDGNRRRNRWVMGGGLAAVVASGVVLVLAISVTTVRERLIERTNEVLALTAPLDMAKLRASFDPHATISGPDGETWLESDAIFSELENASKRFGVKGQKVRGITAVQQSDDAGATEVELTTTIGSDYGERPIRSHWVFTWTRGADGVWRVVNARWITLEDSPPAIGAWK